MAASMQDLQNDNNLWLLARELDTENWERIGTGLGLKTNDVKNVVEQFRHRDFKDKAYELLIRWRRIKPKECTLATIIAVLEENDEKALAYNIQVKFSLATAISNPAPEISKQVEGNPVQNVAYQEVDFITTGTKGSRIYRGTFKGTKAAIKQSSRHFKSMIENEKRILTEVLPGHQNRITYLGQDEDNSFYYIAFELCQGNLKEYVESPETFPGNKWKNPIALLSELTEGLKFLHGHNIIHGDIKPQNILITEQDGNFNNRAVYSDFSLSWKISDRRTVETESYKQSNSGFTCFEVLERKQWTKAVDIFSLGCIYYFILTKGEQMYNSDRDVLKNKPNMDDLKEDDSAFRHFLPLMIAREPKERLNCNQILESPLFFQPKDTLDYLTSVVNWIISETADSVLVEKLEAESKNITDSNWKSKLSADLCKKLDVESGMQYNYQSIRDLLRLIRNISQHYDDLPFNLKREFESYPEGLTSYFTTRFPRLIWHVYETFKGFKKPAHMEIKPHKECVCQYAPPNDPGEPCGIEEITKIQAHNNKLIHHVTFSHNGKMVASSASDFNVKVWKLRDAKQLYSRNMTRSVLMAQFNETDDLLLVCIGIEIHVLKVLADLPPQCHVTCKSDLTYGSWFSDEIFLSGYKGRGTSLWLNKIPTVTASNEMHKFLIYSTKDEFLNSKIATTSGEKKLLVSQFGERIIILELGTSYTDEFQPSSKRKEIDIPRHDINCDGKVRDFKLSPDRKSLFVMICTQGNGYRFKQIDVEKLKMTPFKLNTSVPNESALGDYATSYFDININNHYAISVNSTKDAFQWNLKLGTYTKLAHADKVSSVAFDPCDPLKFITASFDGIIKVWKLSA